jgi:hypothetical protein
LPVAATPPPCNAAAKGNRRRRHIGGGGAEASIGFCDRPAGTGDVEDRGEIDVDADATQIGGGPASLVGAERRAAGAHRARRSGRRPIDPLDQASLLVGHHQQGFPQALRSRDRLQAPDQSPASAPARQVVGEEDHAGNLPCADHPFDRGRRLGAGEADHDALPSQLPGREPADHTRPRRGAIAERHPEGEGTGGKATNDPGRDSPAPHSHRRHADEPYEPPPRTSGAIPSLAPECRP